MPPSATAGHVRITQVTTLSDDWYTLRKYGFELRRRDGSWQAQSREAYDRGNGAAILLLDPERRTVILTRQFRLPTFVNGNPDGMLVEAPAGLLDQRDPAEAIRREVLEETGYEPRQITEVMAAYMSPGSVTERLHLFMAAYSPRDRRMDGGGLHAEGEDIEVLELPLGEALGMIARGGIADGKTIMLLYHAALYGIARAPA